MSAPAEHPSLLTPRETPGWFRPGSFVLGLAGALITLSLLGWWLGRRDQYPHFTRFFPAISPEVSYYPTVAEMGAIVRARCRPDQVLVIVGGNSIFYGSGQPPELMWTRRLQELLGDRYCVVNLAFRGATASDGAAVVAEVLRREFPHQIYVANVGTLQAINPLGSIPYRFIFWEAYYKGELVTYAPRDNVVHAYFWDDLTHRSEWLDAAGRVWLDRALHFRDFWNWVAMDWIFTVPTSYYPTLAEGLLRAQNRSPTGRGILTTRLSASVSGRTRLSLRRTSPGDLPDRIMNARRTADGECAARRKRNLSGSSAWPCRSSCGAEPSSW